MIDYHDHEWGLPSRDDQHLFEMLVLEGAQAGLSWSTILNKRAGYRELFEGFEIDKVARFTEKDVERLVGNVPIDTPRDADLHNPCERFLRFGNVPDAIHDASGKVLT